MAQKHLPQGIGTLGEKTLHRVLKAYFQPDPSKCEVRVGPYVADALTESGIVEIHCIICIGVFVKLFRGKEVYKGTAEKPYITH